MANTRFAMLGGHAQAAPFFTARLIPLDSGAVAVTPALTTLVVRG
jgi:hypothetical protein